MIIICIYLTVTRPSRRFDETYDAIGDTDDVHDIQAGNTLSFNEESLSEQEIELQRPKKQSTLEIRSENTAKKQSSMGFSDSFSCTLYYRIFPTEKQYLYLRMSKYLPYFHVEFKPP